MPPWKPYEKHGELTERSDLPEGFFAFPKERKAMTDASHVRNAIARFDQTVSVSDADRELAFASIEGCGTGVEMSETRWQELGGGRAPAAPRRTARRRPRRPRRHARRTKRAPLTASRASFRGASEASEPGKHSHDFRGIDLGDRCRSSFPLHFGVWIPGSLAALAPRNDGRAELALAANSRGDCPESRHASPPCTCTKIDSRRRVCC